MIRKLSAATLPILIQPQQLNATKQRTLRNQINAMISLAQRRLDESVIKNADHEGLQALLTGFQAFASDYAAILDDANQSGKLSFLLHSGIERLLQEWSILSRVCEQRAEAKPENMRKVERERSLRYYLEQADERLGGYCDRWKAPESAAYAKLKTPVVYFEKLYRISRALFALDTPVISIPLSDYDAPERWQALAHEMGHHIFWNAVVLDKYDSLQYSLRKEVIKAVLERHGVTVDGHDHPDTEELLKQGLLKRVELWGRWLEEVFADVCGVLFAGPAFAYSAQELAAASVSKLDDLVGDSGQVHPSLYLRPLISLEVVRILAQEHFNTDYGKALLNWAGANETASGHARWRNFTRDAANLTHPDAQVTLDAQVTPDEKVTLEDLAADVSVVVETVLKARVWPENKCLWDLIILYGPRSKSETERYLQELEDDFRWYDLPKIPDKHDFPPLPDLKALPNDNRLTPVMRRIADDLEANHIKASERPCIFWTALSKLDIEYQTAHYQPHKSTNNHYHGAVLRHVVGQWHSHSPDGATINWE